MNNGNMGIDRELVATLYSARLYLPAYCSRWYFLLLRLWLPVLDFATDWINAGYGLFFSHP